MSIIVPPFVTPVLMLYGVQHLWPGVDEDKVVEWGDEAGAWVDFVVEFADEMLDLLGELAENAEAESLVAIRDGYKDARKTADPFLEGVKIGIPLVTHGVHAAVTTSKLSILSYLGVQLAIEIPAIMSGVGLPAVLAKKALTQALISAALQEVLNEVVAELTKATTSFIDLYWLDGHKDALTEELSQQVGSFLAAGVADSGPGASSGSGVLNVDTVDIASCISKMAVAVSKFDSKMKNPQFAQLDTDTFIDSQVGAGADSLIRTAIAEVLKWGIDKLIAFAIDLGLAILDVMTEMLNHASRTLTDAEAKCAVDAEALRMTLQTLKPVGIASSDAGSPDFFAPVRDAFGIGVATSSTTHSVNLDTPVDQLKGAGVARANPQDVAVLDAPVVTTPGLVGSGSSGSEAS